MVAGAVLTFRVVIFLPEVVSIFFQRVPRIQNGFLTDRDSSRVADAKINTSCLLT